MKIKERNLKSIRNEAIRQFNEQSKILERYSNVSQIIMGFVIVFLVYFLISDTEIFIDKTFSSLAFLIAVFLMILSFIFVFKAFRLEDFHLGAKMTYLLSELKNNKKVDLRIKNLKILMIANKKNRELIKRKSKSIKRSLWLYFIGFLIFVMVKLIYLFIY